MTGRGSVPRATYSTRWCTVGGEMPSLVNATSNFDQRSAKEMNMMKVACAKENKSIVTLDVSTATKIAPTAYA
jgi:hypothetical protein